MVRQDVTCEKGRCDTGHRPAWRTWCIVALDGRIRKESLQRIWHFEVICVEASEANYAFVRVWLPFAEKIVPINRRKT